MSSSRYSPGRVARSRPYTPSGRLAIDRFPWCCRQRRWCPSTAPPPPAAPPGPTDEGHPPHSRRDRGAPRSARAAVDGSGGWRRCARRARRHRRRATAGRSPPADRKNAEPDGRAAPPGRPGGTDRPSGGLSPPRCPARPPWPRSARSRAGQGGTLDEARREPRSQRRPSGSPSATPEHDRDGGAGRAASAAVRLANRGPRPSSSGGCGTSSWVLGSASKAPIPTCTIRPRVEWSVTPLPEIAVTVWTSPSWRSRRPTARLAVRPVVTPTGPRRCRDQGARTGRLAERPSRASGGWPAGSPTGAEEQGVPRCRRWSRHPGQHPRRA